MTQQDTEARAREVLARMYEHQGNKAAAFTLRQVGAVGSVLEAQIAELIAFVQERPTLQAEAMHRVVEALVTAWELLPGGHHKPSVVQAWLISSMKPAIDSARDFLALPLPAALDAGDEWAVQFELYEVRGDEELQVALSESDDRGAAYREIMHYAAVYGQDGPVKIAEVRRRIISPPSAPKGG